MTIQMDGRYMISNGKDQTTKLWDMRKMVSPTNADGIYRNVPSYTLRNDWYACMPTCHQPPCNQP